ncbi:hypothetical protein ABOM_008807 [Aspergillus bombycis]|uniref:Uncharacterized protein n=1 Tax=Aspergillus bombycis TaxID=109264 RepID=A0A1F7ZX84_9EURO|nr:hypothetical protein ABOM_008807 [Aspergillus bombycis]OGM43685.1 hypothetical protein ABOM_008807 [Aspergillus bombycis]
MGRSNTFKEVTPVGLMRTAAPGSHSKTSSVSGMPDLFGTPDTTNKAKETRAETTAPDTEGNIIPPVEKDSTDHSKATETVPESTDQTTEPIATRRKRAPTLLTPISNASFDSPISPTRVSPTRDPLINRPKPQSPVIDFRANLRKREVVKDQGPKEEPEFKNVFGKLKKTESSNYVPSDELKDNILRGKAALNATGGPKKNQKVDELKDSILKQREAIKSSSGSLRRNTAGENDASMKVVPEAIAKRHNLTKSSSAKSNVSDTPASLSPREPGTPQLSPQLPSEIERVDRSPSPRLAAKEHNPDVPDTQEQVSEPVHPISEQNSKIESSESEDQLENAVIEEQKKSSEETIQPVRALPSGNVVQATNLPASAEGLATKDFVDYPSKEVTDSCDAPGFPDLNEPDPLDFAPKESTPRENLPYSKMEEKKVPVKEISPEEEPATQDVSPPSTEETGADIKDLVPETEAASQGVSPSLDVEVDVSIDPAPKEEPSLEETLQFSDTMEDQLPTVDSALKEKPGFQGTPQFSASIKNELPAVESVPEEEDIIFPEPTLPLYNEETISKNYISKRDTISSRITMSSDIGESETMNTASKEDTGVQKMPSSSEIAGPEPTGSLESEKSGSLNSLPSPTIVRSEVPSTDLVLEKETESRGNPASPDIKELDASLLSTQSCAGNSSGWPLPDGDIPAPAALETGLTQPSPPTTDKPTEFKRSIPHMAERDSKQRSSASLVPQADESLEAISGFFRTFPNSRDSVNIDAQLMLTSKNENQKIRTLRMQMWEITGDGKKQDLPVNQEYILYEGSMYLCVHLFEADGGARSEAHLWCGDDVPDAAIDDAQSFSKKVAKENGCKLEVIKQGKETARFIQALGGILITRRGLSSRSSSSAFFMLCGRKHLGQMVFDEVNFSRQSLCPGYPFVISAMFGKVYLWKGKGSAAEEVGAARLIGMDLGLTGEFEEVAEGEEPESFFECFPQYEESGDYMRPDYWRLKPNHACYRPRLLRIDHELGQQRPAGFWLRRPGSASPVIRPNDTVQEIEPFCQKDIKANGIYVLDTFFEIYV